MGHIAPRMAAEERIASSMGKVATKRQAPPAHDPKPSGQTKHRRTYRRPAISPSSRLIERTDFNRAVTALWPWIVADYPGILAGVRELFRGRVAEVTIKKWRQGYHRHPEWANDLLIAELNQRIAALEHARKLLADLAKEKSDRS